VFGIYYLVGWRLIYVYNSIYRYFNLVLQNKKVETIAEDMQNNNEKKTGRRISDEALKEESVDNYFDSFWKENDLSVEYFVDIVKKTRTK